MSHEAQELLMESLKLQKAAEGKAPQVSTNAEATGSAAQKSFGITGSLAGTLSRLAAQDN